MTDIEKIELLLSKTKLTKGLIASIVFVLIGLWLLVYQPTTSNSLVNNPFVKYGAAIACVIFFGFGIFYFAKKLSDKKPGIVIDNDGIHDNSSAVSVGFIPWSNILQFVTTKVMKQEFLIIIVDNPATYIDQQTNFIKKKGMEYNFKTYGSPLAISANGLKCSLSELMTILEKKLLQHKQEQDILQRSSPLDDLTQT